MKPIRGEGDAIRARAPHVLEVYRETRAKVLESGVVEPQLKQLCARYFAGHSDATDSTDERQRVALGWANDRRGLRAR